MAFISRPSALAAILLIFAAMALGHGAGEHDAVAPSSNETASSGVEMKMYFHFSPGDYVLFKGLTPSTPGAVAGAAFVIFVVGIGDRALAAYRAILEAKWANRARQSESYRIAASSSVIHLHDTASNVEDGAPPSRGAPPFNASQDLVRGALHTLQTFLHYSLMLISMTFQVAYFIAIVLGLGVGEMLFARFAHSAGSDGGRHAC